MNLSIFFFGSSRFALPSLEALVELGFRPIVLTKPDKPKGRGKKPGSTPVKTRGLELGLPVWEPETLQSEKIFQEMNRENPDLIVSAAYGAYVPVPILRLPRLGAVNLHPSLLPSYRGAAPVQRALMAGESMTGITLAYMGEQWDSGDILLQEPFPIDPEDNAGSLLEKLSIQAARLLRRALPLLVAGELHAVPQDHGKATQAPAIKDSETWIDWTRSAFELRNRIRGLSPNPGAQTVLEANGEKVLIKILAAHLREDAGEPGAVVRVEKEGGVVACGRGALLLSRVQPESRKIMGGRDFLNGYRIQTGRRFLNR